MGKSMVAPGSARELGVGAPNKGKTELLTLKSWIVKALREGSWCLKARWRASTTLCFLSPFAKLRASGEPSCPGLVGA